MSRKETISRKCLMMQKPQGVNKNVWKTTEHHLVAFNAVLFLLLLQATPLSLRLSKRAKSFCSYSRATEYKPLGSPSPLALCSQDLGKTKGSSGPHKNGDPSFIGDPFGSPFRLCCDLEKISGLLVLSA